MFTNGPLHRRAPWTRPMATCLALAMVFPPAAQLLPAARAQEAAPAVTPAGVKSILLFPAASSQAAGDTTAALAPKLDDAIKLRLNLIGHYQVTTYTKFLPSVQRGLSEADNGGGLTDADVRAPFGTAAEARAQKIAALVGTDAFLLTNIVSDSQDATSRRVSIVVNSRVYNSRTGVPVPGLGGTFSGAAGPTAATDTDADIQQSAINDAAGRVTSSLNAAASSQGTVVAPSSQRGSSHDTQTVIAAVLVGALLYAIINGSHFGSGGGSSSASSSSSGSGNPPGPPSSSGTTTGTTTGGSGSPPGLPQGRH